MIVQQYSSSFSPYSTVLVPFSFPPICSPHLTLSLHPHWLPPTDLQGSLQGFCLLEAASSPSFIPVIPPQSFLTRYSSPSSREGVVIGRIFWKSMWLQVRCGSFSWQIKFKERKALSGWVMFCSSPWLSLYAHHILDVNVNLMEAAPASQTLISAALYLAYDEEKHQLHRISCYNCHHKVTVSCLIWQHC